MQEHSIFAVQNRVGRDYHLMKKVLDDCVLAALNRLIKGEQPEFY